ncbi:M20/M25/M40 family metallo-hydrolase [Segetibacter sp. 3557_3]|nr:M20/M25/M40 family metallo-hydrolase [Segetibacter sp. 3557_3]
MFITLTVLLFIASCSQKESREQTGEDGLAAFSADSLGAKIAVLASDSFGGRKPFTPYETKTINFLKNEFLAAGIEPGNGDSYFQDVPMVNISTIADSSMQVEAPGGNFTLRGFHDYVVWTDKTDPVINVQRADVIFAGYGVVAPEYNWNDYAELDVKGKIVLVMVNDPGFSTSDTSLFKGTTMTYYGRWTYKFEEAARQGAKGCLVIHNQAGASYPFTVPQNNWNGSHLHLDDRGKNVPYSDIIGWISGPAASRLLAAGGKDSTLFAKASQRGFKAEPLSLKVSTSMKVQATYNMSHNVIAKITGSKRPDETIIYTAHWDHLGFGKPDLSGDSIYNGALDNASATAGLLELARAFKSLKVQPERTIVFLSVTAEEQGLWGSAWYAQNPVYPIAKTVANINMDGLNPGDATHDIITIGKGQSDLEDYLEVAAKKAGRVLAFETHPEAGYYYRSDHFNFAKVGVPALYTKRGVDVPGKGATFGEAAEEEYRSKHYHRPSDEYDPKTWTLKGAIDDLKLLFLVGKRLAYETTWPKWKEGSEFKAFREKN